ncbi:SGNH/GDSL hydrolase family protein, partial [Myxosarcina sp. GI1]|uniref:SGNH/GDSL hydrolase family protein n=1 Tax=Myxosarcina sp. GI1 TaxID=1541065 RepID=UPI000569686B
PPADDLPVPEADAGVDLPDNAQANVPTSADEPPTDVPGFDPTMPPPDDFNANDFDPLDPTLPQGVEPSVLIPGPVDPVAPVITESNPFADYFDPFFGVYLPARGEEPVLPNGEDGYTVDDLFVFGDRLTENGGEFGKNAVAKSTGANPPYDEAPYSPLGNFTDGLNWTTYLARALGVEDSAEQDTNFSYLDATARNLVNPVDPFGEATELNTFAGQINTFEETYGTFTEDDLAIVNFGGNDLTLPPEEGVAPEEAAQQSIQATIDGIASLQELGAENFLVGLVPPVELAPIFSDREFLDLLGVEPGFFEPVVENYNQGLTAALEEYEAESGANIEIFDTNALFDAIAAEPEAYGFVNVDEPVLSSQTPVNGEPIKYNEAIVGEDPAVQHSTLFLDPYFHPTALGHSIAAEAARDELLDLGEAISGSTPKETGLTIELYDADKDTSIASLKDGMQIQASEIADKNLTISATVPENSNYFEEVESVFLNLNDGQVTKTENFEPYALFGADGGEDFKGGIDLQGENTISFDLYSQDRLGGEMLGSINIDFSIV